MKKKEKKIILRELNAICAFRDENEFARNDPLAIGAISGVICALWWVLHDMEDGYPLAGHVADFLVESHNRKDSTTPAKDPGEQFLIAAAPDLLRALKGLHGRIATMQKADRATWWRPLDGDLIDQAWDAIRKAEGER